MRRFDSRNLLVIVLAALLVWQLAGSESKAVPSTDGGGGDSDRGLMMVTGAYGSGASALYVMDTRTRHLTVYRLANGRKLELMAARDCMYDFYLESYNDDSVDWLRPGALRKSWQRFNQGGGVPTRDPSSEGKPDKKIDKPNSKTVPRPGAPKGPDGPTSRRR